MFPATCALLERLAAPLIKSIRDHAYDSPDVITERALLDDWAELVDLLDKARHELKGGA